MTNTDLSGRLARWAIQLQGFVFKIEHRKGSQNVVPDALSRSFEEPTELLAIEVDVFPEIDLQSDAFQSEEYIQLRDRHMLTHGKDYKLLRNIHMLSEGSAKVPRADEFPKIRADIAKRLIKAYEKNRNNYDLRARPRTFEVGQEVIKRNFVLSNQAMHVNAKLAPVGIKARIKEKRGQSLYLLEDYNGKELGVFHAKDIW
ncbi:hypothetical protein KR067_005022 [Drosophila pandora]|nr:hypothetical protein KR067_005022 [Drosophila pandora]